MERLTFGVSGGKVAGRTLSGIAHVYGTPSDKYGGTAIAPGAFSKSIASGNVVSFAHHDTTKLLATQKAGTLRLYDSPKGLAFEIDLPEGVSYAEDLRALVASGVDIGMSFQMPMESPGASVRAKGVRMFTDANLFSVDPVILPAFDGTSVMLHSQGEPQETAQSQTLKIRARIRGLM